MTSKTDTLNHSSLDKIILQEMQFFGRHGVLEAEKTLGQTFIVSLELSASLAQACKTDCLTDTINYAGVYADVKSIVTEKQFDLIEALAESIAETVLNNHEKVMQVKVKIKKPQAPIEGIFAYMGVEIVRSR